MGARSPEPDGRWDVEGREQFRVGTLEQHRDCFVHRACIVHPSAQFDGRPYTNRTPSPRCDVTVPRTTRTLSFTLPTRERGTPRESAVSTVATRVCLY